MLPVEVWLGCFPVQVGDRKARGQGCRVLPVAVMLCTLVLEHLILSRPHETLKS